MTRNGNSFPCSSCHLHLAHATYAWPAPSKGTGVKVVSMKARDRRRLSPLPSAPGTMSSSYGTAMVSMTTVAMGATVLFLPMMRGAVTASTTRTSGISTFVPPQLAIVSCPRSSAISVFVAPNHHHVCGTRWRIFSSRAQSSTYNSDGAVERIHRNRMRNALRLTTSLAARDEGSRGEVDGVYDESWNLGDGEFAKRHLEDKVHIAAKEAKDDFFRKRSLSVYDQMREASMLLLAQQQILAAEEAREESSKPRFVAAAGGTQAARTQAARNQQKKQQETAGLLARSAAGRRDNDGGDGLTDAGWGGSGPAVMIPTAPGTLSGENLGVGGLDEELEEIRRRVCVPLAAPTDLLEDLGISPVRGLLLYGPPGCGKTLLARRLSAALTRRPPAVVSGPEILERFVGSSEANIRALFDYPPDVPGGDEAEQAGALHVIVMDEFDSIGQRRGGGDDGGDRVRDSVVNQLLARMDGFQELERPTLLVALTNRIDLLDSALLRPGRFEVQVQIPGPDLAGREAILRIHTRRMYEAGRIATPLPDSRTSHTTTSATANDTAAGYDSLISSLASVTDDFTGAELAGLVRAAASYALERAVGGGTAGKDADEGSDADGSSDGTTEVAAECRVTAEDFGLGLADVLRSKPSTGRPINRARIPAALDRQAGSDGASEATMPIAMDRQAEDTGVEGSRPPEAAKSTAAAAAVAAARLEREIGGSLSQQDLLAVQKLPLRKTSDRAGEDALLFDAAQVVAQRRKKGRGGGEAKTRGDQQRASEGGANSRAEQTKGSRDRPPRVKKYAHTGWFHTYE